MKEGPLHKLAGRKEVIVDSAGNFRSLKLSVGILCELIPLVQDEETRREPIIQRFFFGGERDALET